MRKIDEPASEQPRSSESAAFDWGKVEDTYWFLVQADLKEAGFTRVTDGSLEGQRGVICTFNGTSSANPLAFTFEKRGLPGNVPVILTIDVDGKKYQTTTVASLEELEALKARRNEFAFFTHEFNRTTLGEKIGRLLGWSK